MTHQHFRRSQIGRNSRGRLAQWLSVRFVKFVLQGTAVRISLKDFTFQSRIYFAERIDGNLQLSDVLHRISQPIEQTAVATIFTSEEERSLGNWSYDVNILGSGMTSYTLLRNSTTRYKQPVTVSL